jgi:D-lactate dehydrogenase
MKIAFFAIEPWEKEILEKKFSKDKLFFSRKKLNKSDLGKIANFESLCVFVNSNIDKQILDKLPKLKYIATLSTGYNHIDLNECMKRNIQVSNVPFYGENTVAEHAFALILGLSRKLVENVNLVKSKKVKFGGLRGFDLKDKTLGVVGGGHIGQNVVKIAKGFGMKVLVFDINKNEKLAKQLGFKYKKLDYLLKHSDIVSLHVPYNKHTHHLLNKHRLNLMHAESYLINTSRGAVIDTQALLQALKNKKIKGAGLDVLENEQSVFTFKTNVKGDFYNIYKIDKELLKLSNVIITPHSAFNTQEALQRIINTTIDNVNGFKKGKIKNEVKVP